MYTFVREWRIWKPCKVMVHQSQAQLRPLPCQDSEVVVTSQRTRYSRVRVRQLDVCVFEGAPTRTGGCQMRVLMDFSSDVEE